MIIGYKNTFVNVDLIVELYVAQPEGFLFK